MKITKEFLEKHGACKSQVELFVKTFPRGASCTFSNVKKATEAELDINWLSKFFTFKGQQDINTACGKFGECPDDIDCDLCSNTDIWNAYVDGHMKPSIIIELEQGE